MVHLSTAPALLAFLAGILTIAAPCTLPVLPVLLGTSLTQASRARPLFIAAGFILSFAAATLVFSAITDVFGLDQNALRDIAVVLLLTFGLLMLWPQPFEMLTARLSGLFQSGAAKVPDRSGLIGGFVLGTTLGLVWTPCAGPVLGAILTVIATSPDAAQARGLLIVYAVGAALPLLAAAYGGQFVAKRLGGIARISNRLQQGFGVAVICFALATYFQYDNILIQWLAGFYPNGQIGL
jgi:cytochrome c biogenesis protein CcdA